MNIEQYYSAFEISDEALLETILSSKEYSPMNCRGVLAEFLNECVYFLEDSEITKLATIAKRFIRQRCRTDFQDNLLSKYQNNLTGVLLQNQKSDSFAFFTYEVYEGEQSKVRVSYLDKFGFYGHCTRIDYASTLKEAVLSGFQSEAEISMDEAWAQLSDKNKLFLA